METKPSQSEKVQQLLQRIQDGTKEVFTGENYANYLRMLSQFHNYSFRNVLLIIMQCPGASLVAGYQSWKNNFCRQVKKGETGIQILGYTPYKKNVEKEKVDSNGLVVINAKGEIEREKATITIPAFRPVYVFDVSQTEGEPLPALAHPLQAGVDNYNLLVTALKELAPYPVSFENIPSGAYGFCNHTERKIVVQKDLSQSQTIKTLIHEIAHSRLHDPAQDGVDELTRRAKEVEAESVAFIVCEHMGIDTSDYSFGYIAGWAEGKQISELQAGLERIQKAALQLITEVDDTMNNLPALEAEHTEVSAPMPQAEQLPRPHDLSSICSTVRNQAAQVNQDKTTRPEFERNHGEERI